ncbi:hypothetical protein PCURB6_18760 [Paenibacillus curdlanolyticus]|nr:hypothetical protein PCURB6_18760 [Paenibacillus curdlanolyticus]
MLQGQIVQRMQVRPRNQASLRSGAGAPQLMRSLCLAISESRNSIRSSEIEWLEVDMRWRDCLHLVQSFAYRRRYAEEWMHNVQ